MSAECEGVLAGVDGEVVGDGKDVLVEAVGSRTAFRAECYRAAAHVVDLNHRCNAVWVALVAHHYV